MSEPVPVRADATVEAGLLDLVNHAVEQGWTVQAACQLLRIDRRRVERWQRRRTGLADRRPGGVALNRLLDDEIAEILAVFDLWGERDRSHRRLAHRGSYLGSCCTRRGSACRPTRRPKVSFGSSSACRVVAVR